MRDGCGQIVKWYGSNIDIEDRKRAEGQLRRSSGEGTFFIPKRSLSKRLAGMAEQLTNEQPRRWLMPVNRPGDEFFAGAGFSFDQNG